MSCLESGANSALLVYCNLRLSLTWLLHEYWFLAGLCSGLLLLILFAWRGRGWRSGNERAHLRAEELLRVTLPPAQYSSLQRTGYLELPSRLYPLRTYHIPRHRGRVEVYELHTTSQAPFWRKIAELCVIPTEPMPDADLVLAHKWLIEADESAYLAIANWIRVPYNPWAA
jgi:hypothetical protein